MGRKNSNVHKKNQIRKTRRDKFEWAKGPIAHTRIMCPTGKTGYLSESAANDKLYRIAQHHEANPQAGRDIPIRAYYHDACGSWHLTHKPNQFGSPSANTQRY